MSNQHAFTRCLHALYCEPWLITPAMHRMLCEILNDHISGVAHQPGGRADMFPVKPEDERGAATPRVSPDGIAVIAVEGVIGRKVDGMMKSSGVADVLDVTQQAREFMADDAVRGVLLALDSPGGTVTGVPEAAHALHELGKVKSLVAYTDGLMASAGYWLGSQATAIYAEPSAQVGSIGVYQYLLDSSQQAERSGLKPMLFATGKYKGMGIEGLPLTDDQQARIRESVDLVFAWFKRDIAAHRALADDDMQGQTFYANDAAARNLIDRVGTRTDALAELRGMIQKKG